MISKINEAKGKYKLIRCYKKNKLTGAVTAGFIIRNGIYIYNGIGSIGKNLGDTIYWLVYYFALVPIIDNIFENIRKKIGNTSYQERAIDDLKGLAQQLRNQNIDTTYEKLLESKVYKRKYKLAMEGAPGIIRERYINVPTYDYNGLENTTSILEEHRIGTRKYVLTLGSPKKKLAFKYAYGM